MKTMREPFFKPEELDSLIDTPVVYCDPEEWQKKYTEQRKKAMLHGRIHAIGRYQTKCEHCKQKTKYAESIEKKEFVCYRCGKSPRRLCIDVYFGHDEKGVIKRHRIYSDEREIPLDSYERAFALLVQISEEIRLKTFDTAKYIKSQKRSYIFKNVVKEWLEEKEKEVAKKQITDSSLRVLKSTFNNHILPYFEDMDIREIRTKNIKRFYLQLSDELSSKTHKNIMDDLFSFFRVQEHDELIPKMPKFPDVKVYRAEIKTIDRATQDLILSKIEEKHRPIIFFLTRQICRPGEVLSLTWNDVDLEKGILTIRTTISDGKLHERPKNKVIKPRLLSPENVEFLKSMPKGMPATNIFLNPDTNKIYKLAKLDELWNEACKAVGVQIELYSGTRHSNATQAINAGVDIYAISQAAGHSSVKTTEKHYLKPNLEAQRAVFNIHDKKSKKVKKNA